MTDGFDISVDILKLCGSSYKIEKKEKSHIVCKDPNKNWKGQSKYFSQ